MSWKKGFSPEEIKTSLVDRKVWGREVPAALHKNSVHLNHSHSPKAAWIQKAGHSPRTHTDGPFRREATWKVPEATSPSSLLPTLKPQINATSSPGPHSSPHPPTPPTPHCPILSPGRVVHPKLCVHTFGFLMNFKLWFGVPFIGSDPQDCENIRIINQAYISVLHLLKPQSLIPSGLCQCHLLSDLPGSPLTL